MRHTVEMLLVTGLSLVCLDACGSKDDDTKYGDPEPPDTGGAENSEADGWWEDPDADDGDDDDNDDNGREEDLDDCPEDFDPDQPCEGHWTETICIHDDLIWWCDDGVWQNEDTKPDDDDEESESLLAFDWSLDLSTGTGTLEGRFFGCAVSALLVDAVEVDGCADCSMAMSMTYASVSLTGDDCDELVGMQGLTQSFGHGEDEVFEEEGYSFHTLYELVEEEREGWVEALGGYSTIYEGIWYFGVEL